MPKIALKANTPTTEESSMSFSVSRLDALSYIYLAHHTLTHNNDNDISNNGDYKKHETKVIILQQVS